MKNKLKINKFNVTKILLIDIINKFIDTRATMSEMFLMPLIYMMINISEEINKNI